MKPARLLTGFILAIVPVQYAAAEDFSFDIGSYQKKPYEVSGYIGATVTQFNVDDNSAFSGLSFQDSLPEDFRRLNGELELNGLYRVDQGNLQFRLFSEYQTDTLNTLDTHTLQEAYWHYQPNVNWQLNLGKQSVKWGKGYAWNPVGFIERLKNPNDPEANREGYTMLATEWNHSFSGSIQNLNTSFYALPETDNLNSDLSDKNTLLIAIKTSLLIHTTDLDFYLSHSSVHKTGMGFSFASNLSSNLEIHGDLAWRRNVNQTRISNDSLQSWNESQFQSLLGFRYLSDNEITWIFEWLHKPQAFSKSDMNEFYRLVKSTDSEQLKLAKQARLNGYGEVNPGKDSLYLKASQKDWLDVVYLNAALSGFYNPHDQSFSLSPELIYPPFKNSEIRLKSSHLFGSRNSEYGEKLSDNKLEIRFRWYF